MVSHTPLCTAFGAEIHGIDVDRITAAQFRAVYGIWKRHHVLLFRGQQSSAPEFERFAARFGELDALPPPGREDGEWHATSPHLERPPLARLMQAGERPAGSAIWFAGLAAALRSIPPDLVARLRRLAVRHGGIRGRVANDDPVQVTGTVHPLVIVHPETGEQALYLGRRRDTWFAGLPLDESERLLNIVWSYATAPAVTWQHAWEAGDVLLWNNLTTLHRHDTLHAEAARSALRAQVAGRYTLASPIQQEAA
jgi:taurine dioxygenase